MTVIRSMEAQMCRQPCELFTFYWIVANRTVYWIVTNRTVY